jgi:hypothetical protein
MANKQINKWKNERHNMVLEKLRTTKLTTAAADTEQ